MRTLAAGLVAVAVASVSCLTIPSTARAQPPGSYAQTCRDSRVSDGVLSARCLDTRGGERNTSLNVASCRGDIANINGTLTCEGGRGGAYYPQGAGNVPRQPRNQGYGQGPGYGQGQSGDYRGPGGYNGR
jgi:hypothetical protein